MTQPILWSFRRCPYAMRARLALASAGQAVDLREILLRDKPAAFLNASPSATVPCLQIGSSSIDESLDIMVWALSRNDPEGWFDMPDAGHALIAECDGPFKTSLDRYKYVSRYEDADAEAERTCAAQFITALDRHLAENNWLFGGHPRLADMALLPFIRQFAHVDLAWFDAQPWPRVIRWLSAFKSSDAFRAIMTKHTVWQPGETGVLFP